MNKDSKKMLKKQIGFIFWEVFGIFQSASEPVIHVS